MTYVGYVYDTTAAAAAAAAAVNCCHNPLATTRHRPGGGERAPPRYQSPPRLTANELLVIICASSCAQQYPCKLERNVTGNRVLSIPSARYAINMYARVVVPLGLRLEHISDISSEGKRRHSCATWYFTGLAGNRLVADF